MKENIIAVKSYDFAVQIVNLSRRLVYEKEYVISRQILKSGTSIGANVEEAIGGISKKTSEQKCLYLIKKLERLIIGFDS